MKIVKKKGKHYLELHLENPCPDFDKDCEDVDNKLGCYIGGLSRCRNGKLAYCEPAEGFCPYLNHDN